MSTSSKSISAKHLALIKTLAAKEAARRQAALSSGTGTSDANSIDGQENSPQDAHILTSVELQRILEEEKAKNDLAWAKVIQEEDRLSQLEPPGNGNDAASRMAAKRRQLEYLEFQIECEQSGLSQIDPPQSDALMALLTRATLASGIAQYGACIETLEDEVRQEHLGLQQDRSLLHDMQEVSLGMQRRTEVLQRRAEQTDFASLESQLLIQVDKVETELSFLLRSLIDLIGNLFEDQQDVQAAQLRHLIDTLINKAWDTPVDPYVDVADRYLPAIPAFLVRANVAVEHPRASHRIRLVEFHRATVG